MVLDDSSVEIWQERDVDTVQCVWKSSLLRPLPDVAMLNIGPLTVVDAGDTERHSIPQTISENATTPTRICLDMKSNSLKVEGSGQAGLQMRRKSLQCFRMLGTADRVA